MLIREYNISRESRAGYAGASCQEVVNGLKNTHDALVSRIIPNAGYTLDDIRVFCSSLIAGQCPGPLPDEQGDLRIAFPQPGSWYAGSGALGEGMDFYFDYVLIPTYLAISFLTFTALHFPAIPGELPGYREAMRRGMDFAARYELRSRSAESRLEQIAALIILYSGGVNEFLESNPSFSETLLDTMRKAERDFIFDLINESPDNPLIDRWQNGASGMGSLKKTVLNDNALRDFIAIIHEKIERTDLLTELPDLLYRVYKFFGIQAIYENGLEELVIQKALSLASKYEDYVFIGRRFNLDDDLLKSTYRHAEHHAESWNQFCELARLALNCMDDESDARRLYRKALEAAASDFEKNRVAQLIMGELGDRGWGIEILKSLDH